MIAYPADPQRVQRDVLKDLHAGVKDHATTVDVNHPAAERIGSVRFIVFRLRSRFVKSGSADGSAVGNCAQVVGSTTLSVSLQMRNASEGWRRPLGI